MIVVIDGNNLAYRCKHSFSLSNQGVDVSITYGFFRVIISIIKRFRPSSVIVCWDCGIPEYRTTRLPTYKSNRKKKDPHEYFDMLRQMIELEQVLPLAGIISIKKRGAEADDLMYHASQVLVDDVVIVTSDMDLLQAVVGDEVCVYSPSKDTLIDEEWVIKNYGVYPGDIPHWKALCGDGSDNIQGVPGIGEKTAKKLFAEYNSLVGIFNAASGINPIGEIKGKLGESIRSFSLARMGVNVVVISLHLDRVGARDTIADGVNYFHYCDKRELKKYFLDNAFISMLEHVGTFAKLEKPEVDLSDLRMPRVCTKRATVP